MLTSARIILRPPTHEDRDPYLRVRAANRAHLEPWEPVPPDGTDAFGEHHFDRFLATSCTHECRRFLVVLRENGAAKAQAREANTPMSAAQGGNSPAGDLASAAAVPGVILGAVSLSCILRGPLQQAFVGYWISAEHQGKGLMREACKLALGFAFGDETRGGLGLHRVEVNLIPRNTRSRAVARAVGCSLEGFSPRYVKIAGAWEDHERWAITREYFLLQENSRAASPTLTPPGTGT